MKKLKLNIFDLLAVIIVVLFVATVGFAYKNPKKNTGKESLLTLTVSTDRAAIASEAEKKGTVYFNGTKNPLEIVDVENSNDSLKITLKGLGEKRVEAYVFNGQRILIGQKAEVHGTFFAQGLITEFKVVE